MSARGRVVAIDGVTLAPEDARVSVFDRGFLYGDSVFEVLRTYRGVPFALDEHLERLQRSAASVLINLPVDPAALAAEVRAALAAAGNAESYVRIVVTRGTGPLSLDPDTATGARRVIYVEPVAPLPREAYAGGVGLASMPVQRTADATPAVGAKVSNYLPNLLALRQAKRAGASEALVVDARGQVLEGASSNVFAVKGDRLLTPPLSVGILAGITRRHVLAAAAALGLPCEERALYLDDLHAADEVFITSSIREVVPVVRLDGRTIATGKPGRWTHALHRRFREEAGVGGEPMPFEA